MLGRDTFERVLWDRPCPREPFTPSSSRACARSAPSEPSGVVFAPGFPPRRESASAGHGTEPGGFLRELSDRRLCQRRTTAVLPQPARLGDLGEEAPAGSTFISRTLFLVLLVALGILVALSLLAFALPLPLVRAPSGRPPLACLLRRDRPWLPDARGSPDPALRPVPRLPHVRAVGGAVRVAPDHRRRGLAVGPPARRAAGSGAPPGRRAPCSSWRCTKPPAAAASAIELPFAARMPRERDPGAARAPARGRDAGRAARLSALYPAGVPWAWGDQRSTSVLHRCSRCSWQSLGLHRRHARRRRLLRGCRSPRRARQIAGAAAAGDSIPEDRGHLPVS